MKIPYFYPPQPTRIWPSASIFPVLAKNPKWDAEIKYNGWRLLIFIEPGHLYFYNRHGTIIDINTSIFDFSGIPNYSAFDGELVDRRTKDLKNVVVLWDCAFYDGEDLRKRTLEERRTKLTAWKKAPRILTTKPKGQVYRTQQFDKGIVELYHEVDQRNDPTEEGIVLKNKQSIYVTNPKRGKDVMDWLKIKKVGEHARV